MSTFSPAGLLRLEARLAGMLWLACLVTAFIATSRFIVGKDAAAIASNVTSHEQLFRLGFGANLVSGASYAGATALLVPLIIPAVGQSDGALTVWRRQKGVDFGRRREQASAVEFHPGRTHRRDNERRPPTSHYSDHVVEKEKPYHA
jgi:hypothetical protein